MTAVDLRYNKYHNKKVEEDGYTFDSKAEYKRYQDLKLWLQSGEIKYLEVHPEFVLLDSFTHRGRKVRGIIYKADFSYWKDGRLVVEDVKGKETEAFRIKRKLFLKRYNNAELILVKA